MSFRVTGASIPGSSHLGQGTVLLGKNSQDAFRVFPDLGDKRLWTPGEQPLIAMVSDGVSSAIDSEVGSKLAVRLYCATLAREFSRAQVALREAAEMKGLKFEVDPLPEAFWQRLDNNALAPISTLLMALSSDDAEFRVNIKQLFLFTLLGIIHTEEFGSWIFGPKGSDGVFAANGEITVLEPQTGNKPVSPAYRFVSNEFQDRRDLMETVVHRYFPPGALKTFLIGTDGVVHLQKAEGKKIPGREEKVHPLSEFWTNGEFLEQDTLELYLRQLNTEWCRLIKPKPEEEAGGKKASLLREPRLLLDDTTVVVGVRVPDEAK